jgi:hypothetical protein
MKYINADGEIMHKRPSIGIHREAREMADGDRQPFLSMAVWFERKGRVFVQIPVRRSPLAPARGEDARRDAENYAQAQKAAQHIEKRRLRAYAASMRLQEKE